MTEAFREVMFRAGFKLTRWYGPGALASYVIRTKGLKDHIQNRPFESAVHQASKHAYAGGRFELFRIGRIEGPVYGYDINSAYPYALSNAPSLGIEHGEWRYIERSEEHTSELQSLMSISYAVFCLKKKTNI